MASENSGNSVEESFEEATSSLRSCSRYALASFLVDLALDSPELMEEEWTDRVLGGLAMIWKASLALGIFQFTKAFISNNQDRLNDARVGNLPALVDTAYRYMSRLWRQTAWVLLIETAAEITSELKGRYLWVPRAFIGASVAVLLGLRYLTFQQFQGIGNYAEEKLRNPELPSESSATVRKARATFQNMAMCTGTLIARAAVMPVTMALAADRAPVKLLKNLMAFRTRVTIATLLWSMRRATLEGFEAAVRQEAAPSVRIKLYKAQSKFFAQAAETFRDEAVVKLLVTCASFILPALRKETTT
jgi:hypothetical protein